MLLDKFIEKGREFLGVEYPILGGAMSWVSDSDLVSAISNAGGFGVLAGGNMPPEVLLEEINKTLEKTDKNFAVNLITVTPLFNDQLEVVLGTSVKYIVFAGGLPPTGAIKKAKEKGKKVFVFAPNLRIAQRMIKAGADALIIEGNEAGGHVGPTSTIVLIQEVLFNIKEVPVFVAGGIGTGKMFAHVLLMGAAGVQLGTKFVATHEANVHPKMKELFVKSASKDAIVSYSIDKRLNVIPVRAIKNKGTDEFIKLQFELVQKIEKGEVSPEEASLKVEEFWLGALRRAVKEGDLDYGSLMAGNSVSLVNEIKSVKEVIEELVNEAEEELNRVKGLF